MKHRILIGAVGAAALAVPAAASASPQRAYSAPLVACTTGLQPQQRSLEVDAAMRPVPGTVRMGMRFDLLQRTPQTSSFQPVAGPGLGVWKRSHRGVPSYEIDKGVDNLAAPASYRLRVGFRWYGPGGRVLKSAHRLTKVCHEPDLRPNLRIRDVLVTPPATPGASWHYTVVVRNAGGSAAGPFNVSYSPHGAPAQTLPIAGLPAGITSRVTFAGPACSAGSPPSFTVDPGNQVAESNEADNSAVATC
jgi:hypothetical protein